MSLREDVNINGHSVLEAGEAYEIMLSEKSENYMT